MIIIILQLNHEYTIYRRATFRNAKYKVYSVGDLDEVCDLNLLAVQVILF